MQSAASGQGDDASGKGETSVVTVSGASEPWDAPTGGGAVYSRSVPIGWEIQRERRQRPSQTGDVTARTRIMAAGFIPVRTYTCVRVFCPSP